MKMNLSTTRGTAASRLQPWNIYDVVFKGIEYVTGNNKDNEPWYGFKFKVSGDQGTFEKTFFCPTTDVRLNGESAGRKWELPSQMEQFQFLLAHLLENLAPANFEKFKKANLDTDDFKALVDLLSKALAPAKDKKTKIKLIANKSGYADIPQFVSISKDGEAYISNNWIGQDLLWSSYEVQKMEEMKNATPTKMNTKSKELESDDIENSDDDDLDFEV